MEQYVGILLSSKNSYYISYFQHHIFEYIRFYQSYDEFIMQYDVYCHYVLIPFDFPCLDKVMQFIEDHRIAVSLYCFYEQECKFYELNVLDPNRLSTHKQSDILKLQRRFEQIRLHVHDIIYIESDKVYVIIHLLHEVLQFRMRLSEVYESLDHQHFQRCHQSYIVNMHYIYMLKRYEIILQNGDKIPISKTYTKKIRSVYAQQHTAG